MVTATRYDYDYGHGLLLRLWLWVTKRSCFILSSLSALSIIGKLVNIILFVAHFGLCWYTLGSFLYMGCKTWDMILFFSLGSCLLIQFFAWHSLFGKSMPHYLYRSHPRPSLHCKLSRLKASIQANGLPHHPISIDLLQGSVFYLPPSPCCRRCKTGNSSCWSCMMSLLTLPNETLMIASNLHR